MSLRSLMVLYLCLNMQQYRHSSFKKKKYHNVNYGERNIQSDCDKHFLYLLLLLFFNSASIYFLSLCIFTYTHILFPFFAISILWSSLCLFSFFPCWNIQTYYQKIIVPLASYLYIRTSFPKNSSLLYIKKTFEILKSVLSDLHCLYIRLKRQNL